MINYKSSINGNDELPNLVNKFKQLPNLVKKNLTNYLI